MSDIEKQKYILTVYNTLTQKMSKLRFRRKSITPIAEPTGISMTIIQVFLNTKSK